MKSKLSEPDYPKYLIDGKMKAGKDYPPELRILFFIFITRRHPQVIIRYKKLNRIFEKHVALAEKSFLDYFLNSPLDVYDKNMKHDKPLWEMTPKEYSRVSLNSIHQRTIKRVNHQLRMFYPRLLPDGKDGWTLDPFTIESKDDPTRSREIWQYLAQAISGMKRKHVFPCVRCGKIIISKQKKKYHSYCQAKYFSEKYVKEGIAKRNQKAYRDRKKEKLKGWKKA